MTDYIDHKELAISRLAVQFSESENLKSYIRALVSENNNLENVMQDILSLRSIETSTGQQLDNIGTLVGRPRYIVDGFIVKYFGFLGQKNASAFNTEPFYKEGSPKVSSGDLDDEIYRLYIKAKAFTNHSDTSHESLVSIFKLLFGENTKVVTEDLGSANCKVTIGHSFTAEEEQLIITSKVNKILPLTAGVTYQFWKTAGNGSFGFAGNPFAVGFGNGGFLSEIGA